MAAAATSSKKTVTLNTGHEMPLLGLGTWNSPADEVKKAVEVALENGYTHIDTAQGYGNEEPIGEAVEEAVKAGKLTRDKVFLTTKLWCGNFEPKYVIPSVKDSLTKLKTEYIDLVLLHWPFRIAHGSPFPPPEEARLGYKPEWVLETWKEMEKAKADGLVRSIGVSNFTAKKLNDLIRGGGSVPSVNQVEMHPCLAQPGLVDYCAKKGIVLTAYSPLGSPGRPDRLKADGDPVPMAEDAVTGAAAAHGKSPAQALIRWCIQRGVVCIPKSVTPHRIIDNGNIWDFELSDEEMAAIAALDMGSKGRLLRGDIFLRAGEEPDSIFDGEPETVAEA